MNQEKKEEERTSQGGDGIDRFVHTANGEPAETLGAAGQRSQTGIHISVGQRSHVSLFPALRETRIRASDTKLFGPEKRARSTAKVVINGESSTESLTMSTQRRLESCSCLLLCIEAIWNFGR